MSEQSYLHRILLRNNGRQNKSKKVKMQDSSHSPSHFSHNSILMEPEVCSKQCPPESTPIDEARESAGDLQRIGADQLTRKSDIQIRRTSSTAVQDHNFNRKISDCDGHHSGQPISEGNSGTSDLEQTCSKIETVGPHTDLQLQSTAIDQACDHLNDDGDHIETIAYHPEPSSPSPQTSNCERGKHSRLRIATKAILSLRRATSSLTSHHGDNSNVGSSRIFRGFSHPKSLVASFLRQNTADNSTCTRSSRHESVDCSNNWAHSIDSAASQNGIGHSESSQRSNRRAESDQQSTSSATFRLPQFIVPKMNALKLPIVCLVKSLDGELMREIFIHRYEVGQYLIDNLKVSLEIKDSKYFGLKLAKSVDDQEDVRQPWLELNESIYKQISKHSKSVSMNSMKNLDQSTLVTTKSVDFYLRIKFYPPNLARIQDPFLKKYLWLQLRRDLRLGKLTSSMNNLTFLMACTLQYELDDFKSEYVSDKLPELNVLPNQDMIERQAIEIWQTRLAGSKKHQVLMQFLRASVILETYGFDYYPVRDHQRQRAYLLGFNYAGIKTIRNGRIVHHFRWHSLSKITHERRMIIFHIYPTENSKRKQILGFKCLSNEDCLNLYSRLQEQKYFFTVDLTYFDKSIRHPSHLSTSVLGYQEQQQFPDWTASSTPPNDPDIFDDNPDGVSDELGDQDNHAERSQLSDTNRGVRDRSMQSSQQNSHMHEHPNEQESPFSGASCQLAFDDCVSTSCRRDFQLQHHSNNQSMESSLSGQLIFQSNEQSTTSACHSDTMRACQIQDSGQYERNSNHLNARQPANYDSQASLSNICNERPQCCGNGNCAPSKISTSVMSRRLLDKNTPLLQRQSSVLKYSPDFDMIDETSREQEGLGVTTLSQTNSNVGSRVANWTEQVLTQPTRIFTCHNWTNQPQREQVEQHLISDSGLGRHSPDGSLFMQGIFFCLLVLIVDIALRLSDGFSSALEGLLAFRPTNSETAVHATANCPLN